MWQWRGKDLMVSEASGVDEALGADTLVAFHARELLVHDKGRELISSDNYVTRFY